MRALPSAFSLPLSCCWRAPACPGWRALSGPPLLALGLAGAVVALAHARPRVSRFVFLPAVLVLYAFVSVRVQVQVGPRGDEPHYLMVAESLLRDHDLSLEKDYAEGRYRVFHDETLEPHYRVRGKGGEIYSLHAVGLSLLILPAYAFGGYPGASLFMALVAALLAREVREMVRSWSASDGLAEGVGWAVALSPPLLHYAGLVFTEIPAALGVAFAMRRLARRIAGERLGRGSRPGIPALAQCSLCASGGPAPGLRVLDPARYAGPPRAGRSDGPLRRRHRHVSFRPLWIF